MNAAHGQLESLCFCRRAKLDVLDHFGHFSVTCYPLPCCLTSFLMVSKLALSTLSTSPTPQDLITALYLCAKLSALYHVVSYKILAKTKPAQ